MTSGLFLLQRQGRTACRAQGFTLIELMIVVALVGVLTAIAMPSYKSYREKARVRQASQEIVAMATALQMYYQDARAYPADLSAVGLSGKKDPWGFDYRYLPSPTNGNGGVRKDRALNPINTDFDLYSVGPDGVTHVQLDNSRSLDDVIRATNGAFVGLAADFGN